MKKLILPLLVVSLYSCSSPAPQAEAEKSTQTEENAEEAVNQPNLMIGTYTRKEGHVDGKAAGIYNAFFNEETGELSLENMLTSLPNPSYLEVDLSSQHMFVVNELGSRENEAGKVTTYHLHNGKWHQDQELPSNGLYPCHIASNEQGTLLGVANYGGGISLYEISENGTLTFRDSSSHAGSKTHPRQDASHPHMIYWTGEHTFFVPDLGLDKIWQYRFNTETKSVQLMGSQEAGNEAGPRHLIASKDERFLYQLNELNGTITTWKNYKQGREVYSLTGTTGEDENKEAGCAAIKLHPNGKFIYATNRGDINSIALLKNDHESKSVVNKGTFSTGGRTPRDFAISPNGHWLLAGNQDTGDIAIFSIDQETGALTLKRNVPVKTPVCLDFY